MRLSIAAVAVLCVSSLGSCQLAGRNINDHWNYGSVFPRIMRTATGFDSSKELSYKDFAWERKKANSLTIRRYFLNHNPLNPNQPKVDSYFEPRPLNSLAPNPWHYLHLEGFVIGGGIPIPVDSIIGTIEEGGWSEFTAGFASLWGKGGTETSADARSFYGQDGELPPFKMTPKGR